MLIRTLELHIQYLGSMHCGLRKSFDFLTPHSHQNNGIKKHIPLGKFCASLSLSLSNPQNEQNNFKANGLKIAMKRDYDSCKGKPRLIFEQQHVNMRSKHFPTFARLQNIFGGSVSQKGGTDGESFKISKTMASMTITFGVMNSLHFGFSDSITA